MTKMRNAKDNSLLVGVMAESVGLGGFVALDDAVNAASG